MKDHLKDLPFQAKEEDLISDPLCIECGGSGEKVIFPGGIGPANEYAIVFCKCKAGRKKAADQANTLVGFGA